MNRYRVLMVGSYRGDHPEVFHAAAGELAQALAPHVREFILCSMSVSTVDFHALMALKGIRPAVRVRVVHPRPEEYEGTAPDILELRREVAPVDLEPIEVNGGWRAVHLYALRQCDLVIAVGGTQRGTGTMIYSADVLGKPVALVPFFAGSAAETAWSDFGRLYTDDERARLRGSTQAPDWAANVVNAALSIADRNPFSKGPRDGWRLLATAATAVSAWGLVQWDQGRMAPFLPRVAGLLLGLFFAAAVGLEIRERSKPGYLRETEVTVLLATALMIGFSTLLFNELLNFLVLGKITLFELSVSDAHMSFLRLSLVALLAGVVADKYFEALVRRAMSAVS